MSAETLELILVDDETRITEALGREISLCFPPGAFGIQSFSQTDKGLEYIEHHAASTFMVISDLRMPQMKGNDFLGKVKEINSDIQTLLLTAYVDIEDIQKAVSTNLQGLLFKPWKRESLEAEVKKALETWNLRQENARLKSEQEQLLLAAGEFQRSLFSSNLPETETLDFDILYQAREGIHCGGDFYRILEDRPNKYVLILGDVLGHGPKAALVSTMVNTLLMDLDREQSPLLSSPAQLLKFLNYRLCKLLEYTPEMLVCLSALHINPEKNQGKLSSAGQPPVFLLHDKNLRAIKSNNPILGFSPDIQFWEQSFDLEKGDTLISFTDGFIESVPSQTRLSEDEVLRLLSETASLPSLEISEHFKNKLPEKSFSDDISFLKIKYL